MKSLGWQRNAKQIFQVEKVAWDDKESELQRERRKEKFSQVTQEKRLKMLEKEG